MRHHSAPLNARHSDDEEAYERLRTTWLNVHRADRIEQALAVLPAGSRVLEIGSGTGNLLRDLGRRREDLQFRGVDPLQNYVDLATRRAQELALCNVTFVQGVAEQLPDDCGGPFDAVLSNDTLHHVRDVAATVRAVAGVTRPGAWWLAVEPSCANPYVFVRHALEPGERNFFPARFAREAQAAGWFVAGTNHLFAIPPQVRTPPGWLVRLERRVEGVPGVAGGVAVYLVRQAV